MLTRTTDRIEPITLAHAAPFRIGDVEVQPATRQLIRSGAQETLEPRVMQVLVALVQAQGAVVTRDELTDLCWDGRIVSENAINRVISRLRQVAADFAAGSFQLETITKVGYRIVPAGVIAVAEAASVDRPMPARDDRRGFIALGAGALLAGAGGLFAWASRPRHQPPPEAAELFRRASLAQRQGSPDQVRQAVSFFEQAVAIDPLYAEAWGALALAYRHALEGFAAAEQDSLPGLIRSAAERALALDPDNADGRLALAIVDPYYRHWVRMETDLRRIIASHPGHWLAQGQLGLLLQDVGRLDEGIRHSQRVVEIDPFLPVAHAFLARAYSLARRVQEADIVLDRALARWPAHTMLWGVKFNMLLFSGRPGSAAAFVSDPAHRPDLLDADAVPIRLRIAKAVELRRPADIAASVDDYRALALKDVQNIPIAAACLALLGRFDLTLAAFERYYFGTGSFGLPIAPPGRYDRRYTVALFAPSLRSHWRDARFQALIRRTGLPAYWRATGTSPDIQRA